MSEYNQQHFFLSSVIILHTKKRKMNKLTCERTQGRSFKSVCQWFIKCSFAHQHKHQARTKKKQNCYDAIVQDAISWHWHRFSKKKNSLLKLFSGLEIIQSFLRFTLVMFRSMEGFIAILIALTFLSSFVESDTGM